MNQSLEHVLRKQAQICKTLSNPHRLHLLHELHGGEKTVSELSAATGLRQANVSQHLALMRHTGVVVERRMGNSVFYRITDEPIIDACDLMRRVLLDQVTEASKLVRAATS